MQEPTAHEPTAREPAAREPSEIADGLRELQTAMGDSEVALAARLGVSPRDVSALTAIAFAAEAPSPSDIARRLGVTPASATELVDRLEAAGHLSRARHQDDRRRIQLHMTASATDAVTAHLTTLLDDLARLDGQLTADERRTVARFLAGATAAYHRFATE